MKSKNMMKCHLQEDCRAEAAEVYNLCRQELAIIQGLPHAGKRSSHCEEAAVLRAK